MFYKNNNYRIGVIWNTAAQNVFLVAVMLISLLALHFSEDGLEGYSWEGVIYILSGIFGPIILMVIQSQRKRKKKDEIRKSKTLA